jgi:uncharacterized membrane protein YeaQ/YmgE (transglycosylase-associated protein family)
MSLTHFYSKNTLLKKRRVSKKRLFKFASRKNQFWFCIDSEVEMTITGILVLLLIAGVVGALGQALSGYSFGGCLVSILVGFIGAYVGIWLARQLGLPEVFTITVEGEPFPVLWGIIGSAILSLFLGLLTRRSIA